MNNQEKATELISGMTNKWGSLMAFHKLTQIAKWKDEQFKKYLEKKKESMIRKWGNLVAAEVSTIDMIINELFGDGKDNQ